MTKLIIDISKYVILILTAIYTMQSYVVFKKKSDEAKEFLFLRQNVLMFAIHFVAFTAFYLKMEEPTLFYFYGAQAIYLAAVLVLFRNLYPRASKLLINNMCMLITVGFIMITRLSYDQSIKQFKILAVATTLSLIVPILIKKMKFLANWGYVYAAAGIGLIGLVAVLPKRTYGAKLSLTIGPVTLQPSEFVKILFVFCVASLLAKAKKFKQVVIVTAIAALHVLILVLSKDLGSALIFFVTYLVMLYVATRKWQYMAIGLLAGSLAAVAAYFLFSHVRVRVQIWQDPFISYTGDGYQVAQSLFAIGAGGWFGTGLYQGSPGSIPIVEQDFMFAAICEELGSLFGICLILIYMSCFIMFVNIALKMERPFYRLAALGLGCLFSVQVFLTIGGAMKMIPMTGVTLPLISYGGSSIMSTILMFSIVQGFYISRRDERLEYQNYYVPPYPYGIPPYPYGMPPYGSYPENDGQNPYGQPPYGYPYPPYGEPFHGEPQRKEPEEDGYGDYSLRREEDSYEEQNQEEVTFHPEEYEEIDESSREEFYEKETRRNRR